MRKILFLLFAFSLTSAYSQEVLTAQSRGRVFNAGNQRLTTSEVRNLMQTNAEALKLYNAGRNKKTFGNILIAAGSGMIAGNLLYNLTTDSDSKVTQHNFGAGQVTTVEKEKQKFTVAAIGLAAIIVAIPIKIGYTKKVKKAVDMMNTDLKNPNQGFIESSAIIANGNGLGIQLSF